MKDTERREVKVVPGRGGAKKRDHDEDKVRGKGWGCEKLKRQLK